LAAVNPGPAIVEPDALVAGIRLLLTELIPSSQFNLSYPLFAAHHVDKNQRQPNWLDEIV
jgi:hypothetical protein